MNFNKILLQDIMKRQSRTTADPVLITSNYFRGDHPVSHEVKPSSGAIPRQTEEGEEEEEDEGDNDDDDDDDDEEDEDERDDNESLESGAHFHYSGVPLRDATSVSSVPSDMTEAHPFPTSCPTPAQHMNICDYELLQNNMELLISTLDRLRDIIAENTLQHQRMCCDSHVLTLFPTLDAPSSTSHSQQRHAKAQQRQHRGSLPASDVSHLRKYQRKRHERHQHSSKCLQQHPSRTSMLIPTPSRELEVPNYKHKKNAASLPTDPMGSLSHQEIHEENEMKPLPSPINTTTTSRVNIAVSASVHHKQRPSRAFLSVDGDTQSRPIEKVVVQMRVVFLKVGEIDTLKEIYHAEIFTQARWREPKLDHYRMENGTAVEPGRFWNPLLSIDNILSETKEQYWLTVQNNEHGEAYLVERKKIKGVFLETLELNDFPLDTQDLTITMTSERPINEVDLVPDNEEQSGINLKTFVDQQEWKLHEHIEITKRCVAQEYSTTMKSHPFLSVTCRASRRPGYFYWNVFLVMFFITGLSFATFSLPPEKPENRLQLSFTLFLTSVAFKFVINQSLPKISYLTYMDKYVLMSLAILCIISIWHATVTLLPTSEPISFYKFSNATREPSTAPVFQTNSPQSTVDPSLNSQSMSKKENQAWFDEPQILVPFPDDTPDEKSTPAETPASSTTASTPAPFSTLSNLTTIPSNTSEKKRMTKRRDKKMSFLRKVESDVFIAFCVLYIVAHLMFAFWLYFDACRRRREMKEKDRIYKSWLLKTKQWNSNSTNLNNVPETRDTSRRQSAIREQML